MKIIGVTGSSGAGKTKVCEYLANQYKCEIIDADKVAKQLSKKGSIYVNKIIDHFGEDIVYKNGALNRKKLANIIYHDNEKREKLNQCTFEYIVQEIKEKISHVTDKLMIVIDAPLLYESGLDSICDTVIAVLGNKQEQIERICVRDGISEEEAESRIAIQNDNEFFKENADIIIDNTGTKEQLKEQIQKLKL